MPGRDRSLRRALAVVAGVLLLLVVAGRLPSGPRSPRELLFDGAFVVLPALALVSCLTAGRRDPQARASWRLLAAACGVWAAGSVVWGYEQVVLGDATPFPSWADAGYLAYPPLAVAGLLRLPGVPAPRAHRLRLLCDGVAVAASFLVLAWLGTLANLTRSGGSLPGVVLSLAFPVLDVLVGSVVVVLVDRFRGGLRDRRVLVAVAVSGVAAADSLYSVLAGLGAYTVGGPTDLLYCASFLLLAALAWCTGPVVHRTPSGTSRLLPALPALLGGAGLLLSGRLTGGLGPVLTGMVVALAVALVAGQVLLGAEHDALSQGLEQQVVERTSALARAHTRSRTDALTGLPNRAAFVDAVAAAVDAAPDAGVGVVLLDLDGFAQVNDGLGHDVGDALLAAVADRLRGCLPAGVLLARLGGDEFGVLLRPAQEDDRLDELAGTLVVALAAPFALPDVDLVVHASAGTARTDGPTTSVHHLLRDADTAMYAAKRAGGGRVRAFDGAMHESARQRLLLEADLRRALDAGEVTVHYQPVVDLAADRVGGMEALARWTSPARGPVPPSEFVPAAERSGLVVALERHVLEQSCAQVAAWRRTSPELTVAVNVSARHLSEPDFLDTVLDALHRHGLPSRALVVEVTESLLFHDEAHVAGVLGRLHAAGVGLALDDFGTGYSSLSRLATHPFDVLKIDRAFVTALDAGSSPVLVAALAMARGLGMRVVAEGVETHQQLDFLLEHGCDSAQGFLLSRPGPPEVVGALLDGRVRPVRVPAPR